MEENTELTGHSRLVDIEQMDKLIILLTSGREAVEIDL